MGHSGRREELRAGHVEAGSADEDQGLQAAAEQEEGEF